MGTRDFVFVGGLLAAGVLLAANLRTPPAKPLPTPVITSEALLPQLDEAFQRQWAEHRLEPAPKASELAVFRRLSLALMGTVPSLQEIRRFETFPEGRRVACALEEQLKDRRCSDYLAERFARAFVGTEAGPFIIFRRRRLCSWLSDSIQSGRSYDAIVRDMIADQGIWTDHPATNFVTVTRNETTERPDPERLAARVARACLGTRIDCAQCHDHPFEPWTQADFRGLAAFFGGTRADFRGVRETESFYSPLDRKTLEAVNVEPQFPFLSEIAPLYGSRRERLASWVVDHRNTHFARATANRVWAMMFGRPLVEPVDDIRETETPEVLKIIAADFTAHGYDLNHLIRVIVSSQPFQVDSTTPQDQGDSEHYWASFPLIRLRPEQVAGAVYQSTSVKTYTPDDFWVSRFFSFTARNDFVKRYGDSGADEFDQLTGTIPQRLLMMNGNLVEERIRDELLNASSQIATMAPTDDKAVETAYLSVLIRKPSTPELEHFAARLKGKVGKPRKDALTDLYWTLMNSTEFSWNH